VPREDAHTKGRRLVAEGRLESGALMNVRYSQRSWATARSFTDAVWNPIAANGAAALHEAGART